MSHFPCNHWLKHNMGIISFPEFEELCCYAQLTTSVLLPYLILLGLHTCRIQPAFCSGILNSIIYFKYLSRIKNLKMTTTKQSLNQNSKKNPPPPIKRRKKKPRWFSLNRISLCPYGMSSWSNFPFKYTHFFVED